MKLVLTIVLSNHPQFPNFKTIDLADKKILEDYVEQYEPYSDFNYCSLLCWSLDKTTQFSWLNGNLIVQFENYQTNEKIYSILGTNKIIKTVRVLLIDRIHSFLPIRKLSLVPEIVARKINNLEFLVLEDRDNFDYIYCLNELSNCLGKRHAVIRNKSNRFKKYYSDREIIIHDRLLDRDRQDIFNLVKLWRQQKIGSSLRELKALDNFLSYIDNFKVRYMAIFVKEKLVGFCLVQILNRNYAILHYTKSDLSYQGINQYMFRMLAEYLKTINCNFLNHEQDLGIKGLRQAKHSLRPAFYLKKYIVKPLLY